MSKLGYDIMDIRLFSVKKDCIWPPEFWTNVDRLFYRCGPRRPISLVRAPAGKIVAAGRIMGAAAIR